MRRRSSGVPPSARSLAGHWARLLLPVLLVLAACGEARQPREQEAPAAAGTLPAQPVLRLDSTGHAVYVTNVAAGKAVQLFEDDPKEGSEEGTFHHLLSSFDAYISYRTEWYYEGGAHPSYGTNYTAVTVGDTLAEADLRDLFPEADIYAALQKDPLVRKTPVEHRNLGELLDALAKAYPCAMSFDGFFSSFFLQGLAGDTATVVVGLTHGCEANRGEFTTLTLRMPVRRDRRGLFDDVRYYYDPADL